jgi:diaminohydroxyphosphoribosylaminopyrimidine deaminase/5-amino-6-(5-phosphoribosylamino)uracil reductase
MLEALSLAKLAQGRTRPNPIVGCVIVAPDHNGTEKIVGKGFHKRSGESHAEVLALAEAGSLANGSTAYVSLEPCNHYGRTPPCTLALLRYT